MQLFLVDSRGTKIHEDRVAPIAKLLPPVQLNAQPDRSDRHLGIFFTVVLVARQVMLRRSSDS